MNRLESVQSRRKINCVCVHVSACGPGKELITMIVGDRTATQRLSLGGVGSAKDGRRVVPLHERARACACVCACVRCSVQAHRSSLELGAQQRNRTRPTGPLPGVRADVQEDVPVLLSRMALGDGRASPSRGAASHSHRCARPARCRAAVRATRPRARVSVCVCVCVFHTPRQGRGCCVAATRSWPFILHAH